MYARGGLPLILRYIEKIGLYGLVSNCIFSFLVTSDKGLQLPVFLKQMFAFCIDGTNTSVSYFDQLKTDEGYVATLETDIEGLASSHQMKCFLKKERAYKCDIQ